MSIEAIKPAEHEMGQVVVLFKNNRYVFNLVVRNAFDERPHLSNIESAIQALRQAMDYLKVPNASVMKNGNDLDQFSIDRKNSDRFLKDPSKLLRFVRMK